MDLKDRVQAARQRQAEAAAKRLVANAPKVAEVDAALAEREARDEETLLDLESKQWPDGGALDVDFAMVRPYNPALPTVVVRRPASQNYRKFTDSKVTNHDRDLLLRYCRMAPSEGEFSTVLEMEPGMLTRCSDEAIKLGGLAFGERTGK